MLTASLISTVLGTDLPGANTIYMSQEAKFTAPAYIGDTLTAEVEVREKTEDKKFLVLKTTVVNQNRTVVNQNRTVVNQNRTMVVDGQAKVMKR